MPAQRHRWVTSEPDIPFDLRVLYEDERIIVVDKPHFLPTTPRGMWYMSSALMRLREGFGEPQITPAHRLDRATAGVVVFVRDPAARGAYQMLFQNRKVHKLYECLAPAKPLVRPRCGTAVSLEAPSVFPLQRSSRIVKKPGVMQACEVRGSVNAVTIIHLESSQPPYFLRQHGRLQMYRPYRLHPLTGKTHQLRVHMNSLGLPILGDDWYPRVINRKYDDFSQPLQLVARHLSFVDPFTHQTMSFTSRIPLMS